MTEETAQADLTVKVYDGDTFLGEAVTDSDGEAVISNAALGEGIHNIFFKVENPEGDEMAGAMIDADVSADTVSLSKTINSAEDLAYRSFLASCEEKLGSACNPGTNIIQGIALVVPKCIREAIVDMASGDASDASVGGHFGAILEANRQNIAAGGSVALKDVLKGDAEAQSALGSAFANVESVSVSSAASTAASVLDQVVEALCGDTSTYASVSADDDYAADPGVFANLFSSIPPSRAGSVAGSALKNIFAGSMEVGNGLEFFADPLSARAMMETFLEGGFEDASSTTEIQKRVGVIFGAGAPANEAEAQKIGKAAVNIYGASNFVSASVEHALADFGPLLGDDEQMMNFINGGSQAFDNMIDRFGSIEEFHSNFTSSGDVGAFLTDHPQGGDGASCTGIYDCLPPLNCTAGSCAGATGMGDVCTTNSDCDTANNVACDPRMLTCVYAFGQAGSVDFGEGFAEAGAGEERGRCLEGGTCNSGLVCLNKMCKTPGSGAGSELCGDGRCNGAETTTYCPADCGSVGDDNYCGDDTCNGNEVRLTCPRDCPMPLTFTLTATNFTDDCARTGPTFSAVAPDINSTVTASTQGSSLWTGTVGPSTVVTSAAISGGIWTSAVNAPSITAGNCTFIPLITITVSIDANLSTCTWKIKRTRAPESSGNCSGTIGTNGSPVFCTQTATDASCSIP